MNQARETLEQVLVDEHEGTRTWTVWGSTREQLLQRVTLIFAEHVHDDDEVHIAYNAIQTGWQQWRDHQPCHHWTRGLLHPRHITATELRRVGKESNRLSDNGLALDEEDDAVIEYPAPTRKCRGCDERVTGRKQWHSDACRKRTTRGAASLSGPDPTLRSLIDE